jgi:DNA end-binding protein Ku
VIESKRKRQKIEVPRAEKEPEPATDLMAALEKALQNVRDGRELRADTGEDEDLAELSKQELQERAEEEGIEGRSKMSKKQLVEALGGPSR